MRPPTPAILALVLAATVTAQSRGGAAGGRGMPGAAPSSPTHQGGRHSSGSPPSWGGGGGLHHSPRCLGSFPGCIIGPPGLGTGFFPFPYPFFFGGLGYYPPDLYPQLPDVPYAPMPQYAPYPAGFYPYNSGFPMYPPVIEPIPIPEALDPGFGPPPSPPPPPVHLYVAPASERAVPNEYPALIALKNHALYTASSYWVKGKTFFFITSFGDLMSVPITLVDHLYPRRNEP